MYCETLEDMNIYNIRHLNARFPLLNVPIYPNFGQHILLYAPVPITHSTFVASRNLYYHNYRSLMFITVNCFKFVLSG